MSIWKQLKHDEQILNENIEVDTLIIGGGLTGLLTAYNLKEKNICVVERKTIGCGVTKNSTAKITYLQETIYTKISSLLGKTKSELYLKSQLESINILKNIIEKENIECDFINTPSYLFASTKKEIKNLLKEINFLKENNIKIEQSSLPCNTKVYLSYKVNDTYTFNPIKFLTSIYNILRKNNIPVYEQTKIIDVRKQNDVYICKTKKNQIIAKNVIFASHYPYFLIPFYAPIKVSLEKSYIIISKVNEYKNFSCINTKKPTYSCRFYKDNDKNYQISLGSSHNLAFKLNDKLLFDKVQKQFNLKNEDIIMKYSNSDIITSDHVPYIGKLKNNMYIGCGYNTWGMTNSVLASKILSDLILNKNNEYTSLFNPNRINISNIIKLPYYIYNGIYSYLRSKINKNKSWYSKNVTIKNNIGTYIDEKGTEHKVKNKCPHLGCGLIFNEEEKTWDCPCHGSRFDIDGKCIKGPSNENINLS